MSGLPILGGAGGGNSPFTPTQADAITKSIVKIAHVFSRFELAIVMMTHEALAEEGEDPPTTVPQPEPRHWAVFLGEILSNADRVVQAMELEAAVLFQTHNTEGTDMTEEQQQPETTEPAEAPVEDTPAETPAEVPAEAPEADAPAQGDDAEG